MKYNRETKGNQTPLIWRDKPVTLFRLSIFAAFGFILYGMYLSYQVLRFTDGQALFKSIAFLFIGFSYMAYWVRKEDNDRGDIEEDMKFGMVSTLLTLFVALILFVIASRVLWKPGEVRVTIHRWDYEQQVIDFQPRPHEDWSTSAPAGAYNIATERKYTSSSHNGANCFGTPKSGYYCDYTHYTLDEWGYQFSTHNSGEGVELLKNSDFLKPDKLNVCEIPNYGCQKLSQQILHHYLDVVEKGDGEQHTCEMNDGRWELFRDGQNLNVLFNVVYDTLACDSLNN